MTKQLVRRFVEVLIIGLFVSISSAALSSGKKHTELVTRAIEIPPGKPTAPVSLSYTMPAMVLLNQPISISLDFSSSASPGSLQVSVNADEGLILLSEASQTFSLQSETVSSSVSLMPESNGLHYLNINVIQSWNNGESRQARAFSLPVQVGLSKAQPKVNGKLIESGDEKIIEMLAE